jgi:isocitrate dehydrogenase
MTKDNIMKLSDGLFHQVFDEVAREYPDIKSDHLIIDIGAARLAASPEIFDVIVTLNLYGDILSDIAAQIAGSVGFASSANVGETVSMFEAVHGSAPDIAGRGIANPSGLLIAATQMLVHIGLAEYAEKIKNAWLCTIEDGIHTPDVYRESLSQQKVGTQAFADAIIERLGDTPKMLDPVVYYAHPIKVSYKNVPAKKSLVGIDLFLDWDQAERNPNVLAEKLHKAENASLKLSMITNRGVKVYPEGLAETFCTDHWRCRFKGVSDSTAYSDVLDLMSRLSSAGLDIIKSENLYTFDGVPGYSLGQGE